MLEGLYVQDLDKDTLLHTKKFTVDLNYFSLKERIISVNTAQLDDGKFFLKTYKTGKTNLQFIINYFNTGTIKPTKIPKKKYDLTFDKVVLNSIDFKYKNFNRVSILKRINFDDLHLLNLSTTVLNINTKTHNFQAQVNNLTFREKSGFYLKNLSTLASIDSNQMEFKNLLLQTPNTQVSDYLLLKYNKFKDLNKFASKVYFESHLKDSYLHTKDIAFFSDVKKLDLKVKIRGDVSGYLNDLKARNFAVSAGQATYLKGNFDIKGLPDVNKTYVNLRIDQFHSNKKDADRLIKAATGKTNQIPAIAAKFGDVSFRGNFSGYFKNFKANGEVKTALGRVVTNLRMNLNGIAKYSGTVTAYDFNLGELLNRKDLGRTSLSAKINGQGFDLKQLQENIYANLSYFDYKGYRYTNVKIDGKYNGSFFNGEINVNDRNIKLDFLGKIDFTSKLPSFNFNATLRNTNLHKLGFVKDTMQIDADFHTAFVGNSLDNIQGNLQLKRIRMTTPKHSLVVDSVYLVADGLGNKRSLTINSDILDAGIRGQYDLKNLPYYFTSLVKKYVPSIRVKVGKPGIQNFDFTLNLKYFEPISLLFFPDLKIPEGADFTGNFVSAKNIATLTGASPLIEYKEIKINNFIIDES
ncbi:MAG: translocation/assembly module TamB, partial [Pyrinomonadaceae bacterium]|nr:translocation/assembly module TamB [Sphingobacteriaceae bacterium]